MNKRQFRDLHPAVMIEAVLKLLYPEATLSEALRRAELTKFDPTLFIGKTDEKPDGFIFRKTITELYLVTNKSLINIGTSQGLQKANLGWVVQKLVKDDLYLKAKEKERGFPHKNKTFSQSFLY